MTKFKISKCELRESLHTGLRKLCDTSQSSLTWQLIHDHSDKWRDFVDIVHSRINDTEFENLTPIRGVISDSLEVYRSRNHDRNAIIMYLALEILDEEDISGMCGFLKDSIKKYINKRNDVQPK